MQIDLTGRTAIITGSTAGIGRATAEGLARAGAAVVVNGRGHQRVEEAVRQIRQASPRSKVSGVAADLSTLTGVEDLIAQAPDADILVNNVGTAYLRDYAGVEDIARIPDADWLALFEATCRDLFDPAVAAAFEARAQRIARSLQMGLFERIPARSAA